MPLVFSLKQTAVPAGLLLAGLLGPQLTEAFNWHYTMLFAALACLVFTAMLQPLRKLFDDDRIATRTFHLSDFSTTFKSVVGTKSLRNMSFTCFAFNAAQTIFTVYFVVYLTTLGYTLVAAGFVFSTAVAIAIESAFKIGPLFDGATGKVNPKGWNLNVPAMPSNVVDTPDFGLLGQFSLFGSFERISLVAAILFVFTLLLSDFFDTVGTVTAIGHESGLIDSKGDVPNNNKILFVDSVAAMAGGAGSISSNTSYIESAAGVGEGARTGLSSVVTGVLFLLTTFLAPLVAVIPYEAATPALVVVGFLMMSQIKGLDWADYGIGIPAFLTIILMPFTYNISVGIGAGFVSHVVIRIVQGRRSEVHPLLLLVSGLFMVYFLSSPINTWIG
jgi:xanthine/uracil/vitamin C permease (AzgA family)